MFKRHATLMGGIAGILCAVAIQIAPVLAQGIDANGQTPRSTESIPGGSDSGILVEDCMVRFINKTKLPAETQGKLTELNVEEGMSIKKGDIVAVVDAQQALMAVRVKKAEELEAKLNAQNDINKEDAIATEKIAAAEAKTFEVLHSKGAAPYWEWRKKQAEADRAKLRIRLADVNTEQAMAVYASKLAGTEMAEYEVEMRTIRAEFDAYVETRYAQKGEWVQAGSPIVEIVQMDRVRVEGFVSGISYAGQFRRGSPVQVEITVGGTPANPRTKRYEGAIEYVSTELDINQRHRIWVSIPNERVGDDWLIKPGMSANMRILSSNSPRGGIF